MKKGRTSEAATLRQKAEEQLKLRKSETNKIVSETDSLKLIHELEVHQIELEMQNEKLVADITERKRTEALMQLNEEKYRGLFEMTRDAIMTTEPPSWKFTSANPSAVKLFGVKSEEEFVSHAPWEYSPEQQPDGRVSSDKAKEMIETAVREGTHVFEWTHRQVGGIEFPADVLLTRVDHEGKMALHATVRDITERKRTEELLLKNYNRLELAMQTANMAWWEMDIVSGNVTFNPRKAEMLGYQPEQFTHYKDFTALVHPEDYEKAMDAMRNHLSGLADRYEVEYRILTKSGEYKWFHDIGSTLENDLNGPPKTVTGLVLDISNRKKVEEAMQAETTNLNSIFESTPVAMIILDETTNIVMTNQAFTVMCGGSDSDILQHRPGNTLRCVHSHKDPRGCGYSTKCKACNVRNGIEAVIANGGMIHGAELEMELFRNGTPQKVWMSVGAEPIQLNGRPHVCVAMDDITERKQAENIIALNSQRMQTMLKLNQMTEATPKEITDFVLEEAVRLTHSKLGYLAFLNEDESVLTMHSWSKFAMAKCAINEKPIIFPVASTGLWGEAVRQRRPVITNDYTADNPLKKGYPQGHVAVKSHMNIPVFVGSRIVIVAGVGNKAEEYVQEDIEQLTLLMEAMWRLLERKNMEEALKRSEEKYRAIVEQSTDGIVTTDEHGTIDVWNTSIEAITGMQRCNTIGKPIWEVQSWLIPDEIITPGLLIHLRDSTEKILELKMPWPGESREQLIKCADGTHKVVQDSSFTINFEGRVKLGTFLRDITERKQAEDKLRESEVRYKALFTNSADGILVIKNETTQFLYSNPALCKMFGYTEKEIISLGVKDIVPKGSSDYALAELKAHIQGEKTLTSDLPCLRKNGTLFYADVTSTSMVLDGFPCNVGFFTDITERKQAEEKLRSSEERLRILFDYAPDAYYLNDLKGYFIDGNIACEKLMGYNKNELVGRSFLNLNLLSLIQLPRAAKLLIKNSLGQATGPDEFELNRKDGSTVTVEILTHPVKINDQTLVLGLARDISERNRAEKALLESEEKFRSTMENSADAIFITDQQGKYQYVNKAVTDLLGFASEEMKNKTIMDLSPPRQKDKYFEIIKKIQTKGKTLTEIDLLRKDGNLISTELHSVLLPGGLVYGSCRDITEKKKAQKELLEYRDHLEELVNERTEELSEAKKKEEESNKAKSEFLANMSHEIRTPMNAVLGYADLLVFSLEDKTQKEYAESIKSSGRSLLTLINDILDLSKIEAGKLELEFDYINTNFFFSEFEKIFSMKISEKKLKFILDITSGTPAGIYVDETRLRQIMFNLIGNAIKFTEKGHVKIKTCVRNPQVISYEKGRQEEYVDFVIEVEDTGIGISDEFQKQIFNPFTQQSGQKKYGGTGLGLAITKRLIGLMNGTISFKSELDKGSTFQIIFPGVAYLRSFEKKGSEIQLNTLDIEFEKACILIADDIESNRKYLIDALKNTNISILEAADGQLAYMLAKEKVPDLIITDIRMPNMNGFELLDKLKQDDKLEHIPVIAYSASVMKDQKEKIHKRKFAGLLIKPVSVTELFLALMNHLPYKTDSTKDLAKTVEEVNLTKGISDLAGLINSMETTLMDIWKTFADRQPINEIMEFGRKLIGLGKEHDAAFITGYGEELVSAADNFNIKTILKLLKRYPSIVEDLKDSIQKNKN